MQFVRTKWLTAWVVVALACLLPQVAWANELTTGSTDTTSGSVASANVQCRAHVIGSNWTAWANSGKQVGAATNATKINGLALKVSSSISGSVQYQVYLKGKGWQSVKSSGKTAGKTSGKVGVEAVRIALTGELAKWYDVSYSVKAQKGSWTSDATNGAIAGNAGKGRLLTAIKVKLTQKETASTEAGAGIVGVRYKAKAQKGSWKPWKTNNANVIKAKKNKSIKSLKIKLDKGTYSGGINYRVRLSTGKWKAWKSNGASIGSFKNVEAIRIKLTGAIALKYDVVYRVNVKGAGWQKRTMNGGVAGTRGLGRNVRSVKITLVEKSKRSGWYGSGTKWRWYSNGSVVKNKLVTTKESPIDPMATSSHMYWIDSTGFLAVNRLINPSNSKDAAAGNLMLATENGYIATSTTMWIDELSGWYTANKKGVLSVSKESRYSHIERYVQWAIDIANDDSHGYSQAVRWGPDYDCSSLVVSSLKASGFKVGNATYTGNMKSELTKYGFVWHSSLNNLQRGDILLVHNSNRQHTEIYIGNGKTVGAHIAETGGIYGKAGDQTGNEISIAAYSNIWSGFLRYKN